MIGEGICKVCTFDGYVYWMEKVMERHFIHSKTSYHYHILDIFIDRMMILSPFSILSYVNNQIGYIGDKGCYTIGMTQ